MKKFKKFSACFCAFCLLAMSLFAFSGCANSEDVIVLRVANWEEYIDLGDWDEDETIELENEAIFGENSIVDDFTEWFNETHDYNVKVEYSTFGTNEDLYNRLSLGDIYDLVCPSDYMLMKLIAEDRVEKFSEEFYSGEYAQNVSPYISDIFESYGWNEYAACYMWGTTGLVYNPEKIGDTSDVSTWKILLNKNYNRQITIKDNVRDAYFATLGILNSEELNNPDAGVDSERRSALLNDTSTATVASAEDILKQIKDNVYSFETDAGKSDMVTGKVVANYQWSGDAVYIMDEAESDEANATKLWYSVPDECANLWFDGWVMLKSGINGDSQRKEAAEAFVNFLSRPQNAVRNMYYIGYTSAIAGETVLEYMEYNYGAKEGIEYDVSYFFGEGGVIIADADTFDIDENGEINRGRQLFAQYPPSNVIERSVVMLDFGDKLAEINQMWINVRCLDLLDFSPVVVGVVGGIIVLFVAGILLYKFRYKLFLK